MFKIKFKQLSLFSHYYIILSFLLLISEIHFVIQRNSFKMLIIIYYTVHYSLYAVDVVQGSDSDNVDCHRRFINKAETKCLVTRMVSDGSI